MPLMPASELQAIVILADGPRGDVQGSGLGTGRQRNLETARVLFQDLASRRRADEHTDDAEEECDDDRLGGDGGDEVIAPLLDALLGRGAAQFSRDDGEIEDAKDEERNDEDELQDERLAVRSRGQRGEIADLQPGRVEPGEDDHAPGAEGQQGETWDGTAEDDSAPGGSQPAERGTEGDEQEDQPTRPDR